MKALKSTRRKIIAKALITENKRKLLFFSRQSDLSITAGFRQMVVPNNRLYRVMGMTSDDDNIKANIIAGDDKIIIDFIPVDNINVKDSFLVNYKSKKTSILDIYLPLETPVKCTLPIKRSKKFGNDGLKVFYTALDTGVCLAATDPVIKVLTFPCTANGNIGQMESSSMIMFNNTIHELWNEVQFSIKIAQQIVSLELTDSIVKSTILKTVKENAKHQMKDFEIGNIPVLLRFERFHDGELTMEISHIFDQEYDISSS